MGNRPNDVHLHDLGFYTAPNEFGHVTASQIPGLDRYAERALVLPGITVVPNGAPSAEMSFAYRDLRDLGIGASEVIIVPRANLVQGLRSSPRMADIKRHMGETGGMFRLYYPTRAQMRHLKRAGFKRGEHVLAPPQSAVRVLNDKLELRRVGEELNVEHYFPPYRTCVGTRAAREQIEEMLSRYECVFIKEPTLGGGAGMLRITRATPANQINTFLRTFASGECTLIVDAGIRGVDISVQWFIHPDGQTVRRFMTRQYIDGDSAHMGNGIAPTSCPHHALPDEWSEIIKVAVSAKAWAVTQPFVAWAREHHYVGPIGFDLRANDDYEVRILECNGRFTAAGYPASVQEQIGNNAAVAMRNCKTRVNGGYRGAKRALGSLMLSSRGASGIIISMPGCLYLPPKERKTALIAVGRDLAEVEALLGEATERLSRHG